MTVHYELYEHKQLYGINGVEEMSVLHVGSQVATDELYIHVAVHRNKFIFNNQPDALIIQIYSVIKLYMFRTSSLPIIRSFLMYIRHW